MGIVVPYVEYNSVLCNCIRPIRVIPTELCFSFEGYVRSQLHFPMMPYIDNRDLTDYINAIQYFEGQLLEDTILESLYKVLRYFYKDLAVSMIKSGTKFKYDSSFNFYVQADKNSILPIEEIKVDSTDNFIWKEKADLLLKYSKLDRDLILIEMR